MANREPHIDLRGSTLDKTRPTTQGEIGAWLETEAVGASAPAASYLDHLRSLIGDKELQRTAPETIADAYTLAGVIAAKSEARIGTTKGPVAEVHGAQPAREVSGHDILNAAHQFDPTRQDALPYVDSTGISMAHAHIMDLVRREFPDLKATDW